jgi:lysine 2,3-aminomutase
MKDRPGSADLPEDASASPRIALDLSDRGTDNGHHNPYQLQTVEAGNTAASLSFPSLHKTHSDKRPAGQEDGIIPTKTARKQAKKSLFKNPGFPESEKSRAFRRRFYPEATKEDWSDWGWQVRHRIRDLEQLSRIIKLSPDEETAVLKHRGSLPIGITPYYASLLDELNPEQPLRRTHIPVTGEYVRTPGEDPDPLGEDHDTATPGLVHRYPDRVLFLTTGFCSTYCRYCTRSRMVGETNGVYSFSISQWEKAAQYIEAHPEIRDCLLSGGDPLSIMDDKLEWLLARLRRIKHLEFIRIGTKIPVVMPQRITKNLTKILKKYHPLWMSIHFTHPDELTPETAEACERLADAGIPLGSQTVLLKGVNDDLETMKTLYHGLLKIRVKPYYLYQCDPVSGSGHFRTPVEKGLEIMAGLRGFTTGYANPVFVVDAPGGGGKIPLMPDYVVGRDGADLLLTNFEGGTYRYPDPEGTLGTSQNFLREQGFDHDMASKAYVRKPRN